LIPEFEPEPVIFPVYVAAACAVGVVAALVARETRGQSFAEIDARG